MSVTKPFLVKFAKPLPKEAVSNSNNADSVKGTRFTKVARETTRDQ